MAVVAGFGGHYAGLVAGSALFGIAVAFGNPATNQLAARSVRAGRHGIVTGIKQSGVQVGAFLAGFVLPRAAETTGWRPALGAGAALGVAGLGLARRYVPRSAGRCVADARPGRRRTGGGPPAVGPRSAGGSTS